MQPTCHVYRRAVASPPWTSLRCDHSHLTLISPSQIASKALSCLDCVPRRSFVGRPFNNTLLLSYNGLTHRSAVVGWRSYVCHQPLSPTNLSNSLGSRHICNYTNKPRVSRRETPSQSAQQCGNVIRVASMRPYSSDAAIVDPIHDPATTVAFPPNLARPEMKDATSGDQRPREDALLNSSESSQSSHSLNTIRALLPVEDVSDQNPHYKRRGKQLQERQKTREAQNSYIRRTRQAARHPDIRWEDILSLMRVHTATMRPDLETARLTGHPTDLSRLQASLQHSAISTRPIVRFGRTYTMMVFGAMVHVEELRCTLDRSRTIRISDDAEQPEDSDCDVGTERYSDDLPSGASGVVRSERQQSQWLFHKRVRSTVRSSNTRLGLGQVKALFEARQSGQHPMLFRTFRLAIEYLLRHGDIETVQDLLFTSTKFGIAPSTVMYNIFLNYCAKISNMYLFNLIVRKMVDEHIEINGTTWLALLEAVPTFDAKTKILRDMLQIGITKHDNAAHYIAEPIIKQGFGNFLDRGGSATDYISILCEAFGKTWPSPGAVRALLKELTSRDMLECGLDVLKALERQFGFQPNRHLLNVFIAHYTTQDDAPRAVHVLSLFHQTWPLVQPDKVTFDRLWQLAWNTLSYNMAQQVWRFANMHGDGHRMRQDVFPSLVTGLRVMAGGKLSQEKPSRRMGWQRTAGLFVVRKESVQRGLNISSNGNFGSELERTKIAQAIMDAETDPLQQAPPSRPFATAIHHAWSTDREWAINGLRKRLLQDADLTMAELDVPRMDGKKVQFTTPLVRYGMA